MVLDKHRWNVKWMSLFYFKYRNDGRGNTGGDQEEEFL